MELILMRDYRLRGTNGVLSHKGNVVCSTIELPWMGNWPMVSCIPEGRYRLSKRYTTHRGWHLLVEHVPDRSLILLHPANNALRELQGAPVSVN